MVSQQEWDRATARVTDDMTQHVGNFAAPLILSEEDGFGTACGSGTYVSFGLDTWILTAEHVISRVPAGGRLAHLPRSGGQYNAAFGKPEFAKWPVDAAALPIYPDEDFLPDSDRITARVAKAYAPTEGECLFFYGFPGFRVERNDPRLKDKLIVSYYGELNMFGKPVLSQATGADVHISASNFDPVRHVAINYPAVAPQSSDNAMAPLPNAAGMSGCALWDTKFLKCALEGRPWSPELAEICGVVWAVLDDPEVVFATKIEHVRAALPSVFLKAASFGGG